MTTTTPPLIVTPEPELSGRKLKAQLRAADAKTKLSSPWASGLAIVIAILWTVPTVGLLVNSVRNGTGENTGPSTSPWWTFFTNGVHFSFANYSHAWTGNNGNTSPMSSFLLNTVVITLPAVFIPITLALLAAYAFAWIDFKGKNILFVAVFAMQIVPIQVALIPLNTIYVKFGLNTSFWSIWLSHTIFGLPLAIFLLHNFMKEIPASLIEAARVDGAGHVKIFLQVLLPLLVPAIASFGIFQFLWVWNDLLVALTFSGTNTAPITRGIQGLTTQFASAADVLPAAAIIAMLVPLGVFLSLQRFFVRGLLAGSVKGLIGVAGSGLAPLVGIVEVAALAGVSPATVSRALRGLPGVSAATRANVEQAAAALGYVASPSAAALTTGRTSAIGVMAPWISRWFFSAAIEGAQEVVAERGYHTLLYPLGANAAPAAASLVDTRALHKRVDGVLALNVPRGVQPTSLLELRVPLITVGSLIPGISGVLVDDIEVGYLATRHLLELGHRRIAFLGHDPDDRYGFTVAADRALGYAKALAEFGIAVDQGLVGVTGFAVEDGTAAFDSLWDRVGADPGRRPTAVFAVSDEVAFGVLHSARTRSLRVPDELSVIGVDNHDMAYLFELTTIGQPVREQGRIAARMLLEHMRIDEPSAPEVVTLRPGLIRRATTAPVPVD